MAVSKKLVTCAVLVMVCVCVVAAQKGRPGRGSPRREPPEQTRGGREQEGRPDRRESQREQERESQRGQEQRRESRRGQEQRRESKRGQEQGRESRRGQEQGRESQRGQEQGRQQQRVRRLFDLACKVTKSGEEKTRTCGCGASAVDDKCTQGPFAVNDDIQLYFCQDLPMDATIAEEILKVACKVNDVINPDGPCDDTVCEQIGPVTFNLGEDDVRSATFCELPTPRDREMSSHEQREDRGAGCVALTISDKFNRDIERAVRRPCKLYEDQKDALPQYNAICNPGVAMP